MLRRVAGKKSTMQWGITLGLLLLTLPLFAAQLQDPTRPAGYMGPSPDDQVSDVTAIIDRGGQRMAQIDGNFVREGDKINGMQVTQISDNEVTLVRKNKTIHLFVVSPIKK